MYALFAPEGKKKDDVTAARRHADIFVTQLRENKKGKDGNEVGKRFVSIAVEERIENYYTVCFLYQRRRFFYYHLGKYLSLKILGDNIS